MTVFVLWHDNLCHAMENVLSGSKRVANTHTRGAYWGW